MKQSVYSLHPGYEMISTWEATLKERTGRSLEEWLTFVKANGPAAEKERRDWLLKEHRLPTNTAWWIAERAEGRGAAEDYDPEGYVEAMFAGGKAGLRPLYEELLRIGLALGDDVKACPCQTIVPLYRQHVFAELKPSTRTRLDLGLALGELPFSDRLLDTGGRAKKNRITHRIAVTKAEEIDTEVGHWLRIAYELDAPGVKKPKKAAAEVPVPDDLAEALAANVRATAAWEKLPPSHRREHVEAIEEAKKPETRARRIAKAVTTLEQVPAKKS